MKLLSKLILLISLLLACSELVAQPALPFSMEHYGNFTQMMKTGKAPGNISLEQMQAKPYLYGLGALQSLYGEITIMNGDILISRGNSSDGHVSKVTSEDNATMLATAVVKKWIKVPITHSMSKMQFEQFLLQYAQKNGISLNSAFPFLVKGELNNLQWHVVKGLQQPTSKTNAKANKNHFKAVSINGTLIGFYTSKQLEGVISHGGDPFHVHFVDINSEHAGHVDAYAIGANAMLFLPQV